ncbi:GreA/GreB family elongation factor [Persicitalea jodogahamensis]|uniref:Transcription elongation factor n=1 Tax=Persicitalea jodogahamensis TaxID=402147 RepID=A0A8J3D7K0_9BACT|nr:GreA/GreB family elongation factor [Persicitalea jodogahamensis]GHB56940.1 hypothetical protein GCM10007390_07940 [Persicitalea jodogahamensis]
MELKQQLLTHLKELLGARMEASMKAMEFAQESANAEGKSSAGDKYETTRSMSQLDRNMHARQYEQARQENTILERLEATPEPGSYERVAMGSLVKTTAGYFFIAVSAGAIKIDDQTVMVVSSASPVGKSILGKQVGDTVQFRGKNWRIEEIG